MPRDRESYRARLTDQSKPIAEAPQPGRGPKSRGRPKTVLVKRIKISLWLPKAQLDELAKLLVEERARLIKAGKNYSEVTQTSLIGQALEEFLKRRRQRK